MSSVIGTSLQIDPGADATPCIRMLPLLSADHLAGTDHRPASRPVQISNMIDIMIMTSSEIANGAYWFRR
jgi:hypothetical protein